MSSKYPYNPPPERKEAKGLQMVSIQDLIRIIDQCWGRVSRKFEQLDTIVFKDQQSASLRAVTESHPESVTTCPSGV